MESTDSWGEGSEQLAVAVAELLLSFPFGNYQNLHQGQNRGDQPKLIVLRGMEEPSGARPELRVLFEVVDE